VKYSGDGAMDLWADDGDGSRSNHSPCLLTEFWDRYIVPLGLVG